MANIKLTKSIKMSEQGYCYVYLDWNLVFTLYGSAKMDMVSSEITKFFAMSFSGEGKWEGTVYVAKGDIKHAKKLFVAIREENAKRNVPIPLRGVLHSFRDVPLPTVSMVNFLKHYSLDPILIEDVGDIKNDGDYNVATVLDNNSKFLTCVRRNKLPIEIPTLEPLYFIVTGKAFNLFITRDPQDIFQDFNSERFTIIHGCLASTALNLSSDLGLVHTVFGVQSEYLLNLFYIANSLSILKIFNNMAMEAVKGITTCRVPKEDSRFGVHEQLYTIDKPIQSNEIDLFRELREIKMQLPPTRMPKLHYKVYTPL